MLTGSHCCFDIRGGLMGWKGGNADWDKKCCTNEVNILTFLSKINSKIKYSCKAGPVKQPPDNLSREQLDKVSRRANFSLFFCFI